MTVSFSCDSFMNREWKAKALDTVDKRKIKWKGKESEITWTREHWALSTEQRTTNVYFSRRHLKVRPHLPVPRQGLLRRLHRGLFRDDRPEELVLARPGPRPARPRHGQGVPHEGHTGRGRQGVLAPLCFGQAFLNVSFLCSALLFFAFLTVLLLFHTHTLNRFFRAHCAWAVLGTCGFMEHDL